MVDLVSVSYPPVFLIPRDTVVGIVGTGTLHHARLAQGRAAEAASMYPRRAAGRCGGAIAEARRELRCDGVPRCCQRRLSSAPVHDDGGELY